MLMLICNVHANEPLVNSEYVFPNLKCYRFNLYVIFNLNIAFNQWL